MLNHLFTTPVWHQPQAAPAELDAELMAYLHTVRAESVGVKISNVGGWHSAGNLFDPADHRQFPALTEIITRQVLLYVRDAMGFTGEVAFRLGGWAVINGPGDTNAPHNHPGNLVSGVYYPQVPAEMEGGEIVFMDPRMNANAYSTDEMRRQGLVPPWNGSTVAHRPAQGDLLLFPSWLQHYVHSFTSPREGAERTVIAFNLAM